jgi:hypothetical protein
MVPFDVNINGKRVGISFESLFWFFVVTATATVVGELVYDKWVSPYLASLPNLPFGLSSSSVPALPAPATTTPQSGNVYQFPTTGMMNPSGNPNLPS